MYKIFFLFITFLYSFQIHLSKGWNLIGSDSQLDLNKTFKNIKIIWKYKNNKWYFFAKDNNLINLAKEKGYPIFNTIYPREGFWVLSEKSQFIITNLKSKSFYWQLDGDINLSRSEDIYDIDLFNTSKEIIDKLHKKNKIVVCYFSAGSYENFREDKDKFSKDIIGKPLKGWDGEYWLDISKISKLAPIMKARLDLAKSKGCDGVEADNVDGYLNDTGFDLTYEDQLKYNRFLSSEAHKRGMFILLKNDLAQAKDLRDDFDGLLMEECIKYNECNLSEPFKDKFRVDVEYIENENNITSICNLALDDLDVYLATYDLNGTFFSCKNDTNSK